MVGFTLLHLTLGSCKAWQVEVKGGANVTIESLRALKGVLDLRYCAHGGLDCPATSGGDESPQLQLVYG